MIWKPTNYKKTNLRRLAFFTAIFLNVSFMRVAIVIMLYGPHVFWCRKTKLHMQYDPVKKFP